MSRPRAALAPAPSRWQVPLPQTRALQSAFLRAIVLASSGAAMAIAVAGPTLAQESGFYASCVNPSFCSDLPASNWVWDTIAGSSGGHYTNAEGGAGSWETIDSSGNPTPAEDYPDDPAAVVVFPNGVVADLGNMAVQAYSWTLADQFPQGITDGSVEFSAGGGIFSSGTNVSFSNLQITGEGGVYLFPMAREIISFTIERARYNTWISGSDNSYTGPTEITGATLYVSGGGAIGDQSAVSIANTPEVEDVSFAQTGTLIIQESETIGSLAGAGVVILEASLTTGGNGLSTSYDGDIGGGPGALTKVGAGTFTLTGSNSYSGGTFVAGGTLVGNAASISGPVSNAATVVFDQTVDASFEGNITGLGGAAGQMVKQGAGVLTLTGTSVLPWSVAAGGLVSASDRFSGDLQLAAGTSFTFDQTYAGTYAGEIVGSGDVVFSGGGVVTLTGENTGLNGTSTVSGSLAVNGTHAGQVVVADGGTLSGNGTTGNITISTGGTIAPGNSIGTLAVNSDLTFAAGSTYRVEVDGDGGADRLDVAGTATLNGADIHLVLDAAESYRDGGRYDILRAGSVDGRFAPVELASAFLLPGLDYTATDVVLTLATANAAGEPLFAMAAETSNQRAAALALEGLDQTDGSEALALYNAILFSGPGDARAAFDALSGELHASVTTALIEDSRHVRDAMADRLAGASAAPQSGASTAGPGEATPAGRTARLGASGLEAWMRAYGSWGETEGDGNAALLDRDSGGLLFGADGFVSDRARLGLVAGYGNSSVALGARASSASIDSYHVGLYGGTGLGRLDLKAGAAYSFNEIDTARSMSLAGMGLAGFSDRLEADHRAGTAQVFGEASTHFDLGTTRLDPFVNLAFVSVDSDGFGEAAGAAALASLGTTNQAIFSTLGLRAETAFSLGDLGLTAKAMLGWRHAYGDTTPEAALSFAGGAAFTIDGAPVAEDAAVVDLGLAFAIAPEAKLSLHYAGQFAGGARDDGVTARLGIAF